MIVCKYSTMYIAWYISYWWNLATCNYDRITPDTVTHVLLDSIASERRGYIVIDILKCNISYILTRVGTLLPTLVTGFDSAICKSGRGY